MTSIDPLANLVPSPVVVEGNDWPTEERKQ